MTENDKSTESMILAAGLTAPRLSPDSIKAVIASEHYFTANDGAQGAFARDNQDFSGIPVPEALTLLTFCVLVLKNGFTVTGKSACVSAENFDANIGRKVARDDAFSQIWPLEGYLLKQRLFEAGNTPPAPNSALPAHQQRVITERDELADKVGKLAAFLVTPTYQRLADEEQGRLSDQVAAMREYLTILNARIESFPAV